MNTNENVSRKILNENDNNCKSVLVRVHVLLNNAGLKFHIDETLRSKVMKLENEVFSKVKSGTIEECICFLEEEMGH